MGLVEGILRDATNILLLLFILVGLVVIHEFGHFIAARRAGVRVHEFGIGFPPRARIMGRDAETVYTLNWLPIGGFVRLEGEEGESADSRAFVNQRLRTRLVILLAGVAMNFLLAFLIFAAVAWLADPVTNVRLGCVVPGSPAERAGLVGGPQTGVTEEGIPICETTGDTILAIDGRRFPTFDSIEAPDAPIRYLREHGGQTVVLTIRSVDGTERNETVTLNVPGPDQGALGISSYGLDRDEIQRGPVDAIALGFNRTLDASTLILRGVSDLITNIANPQVSGPIGIVQTIGVVRAELPPVFLIWFVGVLSANLAVINALPFPPMDGGRVAVSLVQAVSGNRISPALERAVYLTGFVLLMALLVWISVLDVTRAPRV